MEMFRLLVGKCPESLITEDKWGDIPLLYAIWCNSPKEVLNFLVDSYKCYHPDYEFDWTGMIETLCKSCVPLIRVQRLINVHQNSFANQQYDTQDIVMELARYDTQNSTTHRPCTVHRVFQYLLQNSVSSRLDRLKVERWRTEILGDVKDLPESAGEREQFVSKVIAKLELYELVKEATTVLELSLWKAKLDECCSEPPCKKVRGGDGANCRTGCRINCGADIVIRNAVLYLVPECER